MNEPTFDSQATDNQQKKYCLNCFLVIDWDTVYCNRCTHPQPFEYNPLFLKPPYRLYHQYIIGRVLGHGSFGITYLAYDRGLKVKVAIKEYFPAEYASRNTQDMSVIPYPGQKGDLFLGGKKKFISEAQLLSSLRSPYTIRIRHFFEENNTAYFVMEYLEGQTLKDYLSGHGGRISFEQLRPIAMALLDALEEVHSHNSFHRDIKPDNIYMTLQDSPILLDFGSARQQTPNMTSTFSLLTPGFAPIEQYSTRGIQGPWTDIYGLAATLYTALTGEVPTLPQDRLTGDIMLKDPISLGAQMRPEDEAWLLKGLEVRWNDRPSSVAEWRRQMPPPPNQVETDVNYSSADENFVRFAILPKLANRFLTPQDETEIYEGAAFLGISKARTAELVEQAIQMTGSVRRDPLAEQAEAEEKRKQLEARMLEKQQSEASNLTFSEVFQPQSLIPRTGELSDSISNSIGMEFVLITPFTQGAGFRIPKPFIMGNPASKYSVTLNRQYYLQKHPVTQAQWRMVMGKNPSFFQDNEKQPVEHVSWKNVQEFIKRLNVLREGHYRLPTEAEWEFACRANQASAYFFGNDPAKLGDYAWYQQNSEGRTHPVGSRQPSPFGLFDMYGNVWEWCQDYFGPYPADKVTEPKGPKEGSSRVLRGGSWMTEADRCQSFVRWQQPPETQSPQIGFRLLLEVNRPDNQG